MQEPMKFYQTKQFKNLNDKWRQELADKGFIDQEDEQENLKEYDRRTQGFTDREQVLSFFLAIDEYLAANPDIPPKHKKILEKYSAGQRIIRIAKDIKVTRQWIHRILNKYKKLFLYKY